MSCGIGAVLVQSLGWMVMLPTQWVETGSVVEAVSNTFDGEHPCEFCKTAERMRMAEQSTPESPEPAPGMGSQGAKKLLCFKSQKFQVIAPATRFCGHKEEGLWRLLKVELDFESPPPQNVSDLFVS